MVLTVGTTETPGHKMGNELAYIMLQPEHKDRLCRGIVMFSLTSKSIPFTSLKFELCIPLIHKISRIRIPINISSLQVCTQKQLIHWEAYTQLGLLAGE